MPGRIRNEVFPERQPGAGGRPPAASPAAPAAPRPAPGWRWRRLRCAADGAAAARPATRPRSRTMPAAGGSAGPGPRFLLAGHRETGVQHGVLGQPAGGHGQPEILAVPQFDGFVGYRDPGGAAVLVQLLIPQRAARDRPPAVM